MRADEDVRFCVSQAGDTYDVRCSCGWGEQDCDDAAQAERLWLAHLSDEHDRYHEVVPCPYCREPLHDPLIVHLEDCEVLGRAM